jgi:hypothetical protein
MSISIPPALLVDSSDDSDAIHRCRLHGDATGYERKRKRRSRRAKREKAASSMLNPSMARPPAVLLSPTLMDRCERRVNNRFGRDHPAVVYCTVCTHEENNIKHHLYGTFLHWCSVTPLYSEAPTVIALQVNLDWPADLGCRVDWVFTRTSLQSSRATPMVQDFNGLFAARRFQAGDIVSIAMHGLALDVPALLKFGAHCIKESVLYTKWPNIGLT